MEVVQLHPESGAVAQLHLGTIAGLIYAYQNIAFIRRGRLAVFSRLRSRKLVLVLYGLIRHAVLRRPGLIVGAFAMKYAVFRSSVELFREPDV